VQQRKSWPILSIVLAVTIAALSGFTARSAATPTPASLQVDPPGATWMAMASATSPLEQTATTAIRSSIRRTGAGQFPG